ncbi:hypothetical protein GCM10010236_64600 [Streptomyces eurythermus]|nr:hypothetical protein GCM10010236_64600 [Streptomyces eurythermus]
MNAESQDHWCGYSFLDGTVEAPVQFAASTRAALTCGDGGAVGGSYAISYGKERVLSWAVRSTRGSPKTSGRGEVRLRPP